ncbi:mucin-2-like [Physella acuta]|uniref:mucin-2-like n=1 Tax=Physella acuta TaxID=109671 RepID=UPI0027DD902F|nr:mucin-2-like [Physella acuta]
MKIAQNCTQSTHQLSKFESPQKDTPTYADMSYDNSLVGTPTLNDLTLIQALQPYSNKEPTITTIPHTSNRIFSIHTDNPTNTPHYIQINYKNKSLNILVAINGRKQACQTCSSTSYWTNHCPTSNVKLTTSLAPAAPAQQQLTKPPKSTILQATLTTTAPTSPTKEPKTQFKKPTSPAKPQSKPTTPSSSTAKTPTVKPSESTTPKSNPPSPSTLNPAKFTFTAKPTLVYRHSRDTEMPEYTSPKRKKEHSPTDTKQSKSQKTTKRVHDNKLCRFYTQRCKSVEEAKIHERHEHGDFLLCEICIDKIPHTYWTWYLDIYGHYIKNHPVVTMYSCHSCNLCLPLESIKAHTESHHPPPK